MRTIRRLSVSTKEMLMPEAAMPALIVVVIFAVFIVVVGGISIWTYLPSPDDRDD